ncbi:MAG TPA: phosphoserine phosphatase SerB [Quisquiliibacterium sp.]|nr:phosphoserine phosphatase SerB [Quisquiliibacterium sp.]
MNLVVQHPELSEATVSALSEHVGAPVARRAQGYARWAGVGLDRDAVRALGEAHAVDAGLVPSGQRLADFRLMAFDMDSTLITIECIDEIADFIGKKPEVAAITEAAMRGEIKDFRESLRRRVALLEGLEETALQRVYDERLRLTPGAPALLDAARAAGLKLLLVSGGFTFFTERLRERLGLDFARSNTLEVVGGRLTGRVLGEIVDAAGKRDAVLAACGEIGCSAAQAIVLGDGANDLEMMRVAGVSVAYRAKPVVRAQTTYGLNHCGLDAAVRLFSDAPGW